MFWWTEMDVLKRISYIPHYTLNYIIIAILAILLSKFEFRICFEIRISDFGFYFNLYYLILLLLYPPLRRNPIFILLDYLSFDIYHFDATAPNWLLFTVAHLYINPLYRCGNSAYL